MRTFFVLHPGVQQPQNFKVQAAGELLAAQDLWEHARKAPPSLLFRVRSESEAGALLSKGDRLESCVGIVDAHTRWRVCFAMTRSMLNAVVNPPLRQACVQAMQFVSSQHPSAITQDQRNQIIASIAQAAEGLEGQPKPYAGEQRIAANIARLVQADNDYEAAFAVPFVDVLCPFSQEGDRKLFDERMATIETLSGSHLLTEAFSRLGERAPGWLFAQMPAVELGGVEQD